MTTPSAFGLLLCEKRKLANLTQGQLAQAINKTSQYIYNIEKGKNNHTQLSALTIIKTF